MNHNVDYVKARRIKIPDFMLEPERRVGKGEVLRGDVCGKPYSEQAVGRGQQGVGCNIRIIIPYKSGFNRRNISG